MHTAIGPAPGLAAIGEPLAIRLDPRHANAFYDRGNAYTLELLAARVARGPTDWRKK